MIARLQRFDTGDYGTSGVLIIPGLSVCTIELPWRNNERNISCVFPDVYHCIPYTHLSRGLVYLLENKHDRTDVMIHIGNYAGDITRHRRSDSQGCILPGLYHGQIGKPSQYAVVNSTTAMNRLRSAIGKTQFTLIIKDIDEIAC